MKKARPCSVLGLLYQSASYRVAMDIFQFLDMLAGGEHVEIIITRLPERALSALNGYRKFQRLDGFREQRLLRFRYQQVDVLRYDDLSEDMEVIPDAHFFK